MTSGLLLLSSIELITLPQQIVNGLLLGAIYALIALGYTMVYGVLKLINFAHGEVYMLGAYIALFVAWGLGFSPHSLMQNPQEGSITLLLLMILASMLVCAIVGVLIERLAYRPLRNHPKISTLITAIGVSLLLQYGGALFLPNTPPPSIPEQANPYRDTLSFYIKRPKKELVNTANEVCKIYKRADDEFNTRFDYETKHLGKVSEFDLTPEGRKLRLARQDAQRNYREASGAAEASSIRIRVPKGQLIMLITAVVLMVTLRYLVMCTSMGRAMRAVSHDVASSLLMGINVNRVISFTFFIGSALAGAGAMMNATFMGTPLTTFYGTLPGLKAFVAAVLGGIGSIPGAVLGGLLMGVAETLVVWLGYSSYRDAIAFVVLTIILLFKPGGLLGSAKVEKV
jgi:branched-chain amino acid transport system permease protein